MTENTFALQDIFSKSLNKKEFLLAKAKYLQLIRKNSYELKATKDIPEMIQILKRDFQTVGPYQNITLFEALNRIGSDLVLLSGAEKIFNGAIEEIIPETIHLRMGNTDGFDFEVMCTDHKIIYGEAFNAAPSFCKAKMRSAIRKLNKNKNGRKSDPSIILINKEVEDVMETYRQKSKVMKNFMKQNKVLYCETEGEGL